MKILFINPPWFEGSTFDKLISSNPPLGLAYMAAVLENNGYKDVEIVDMKVLNLKFDYIEEKIKKTQPDIVAITAATGQVSSMSRIIKIVRSVKPDAIIVIGGPHPSALPERALKEVDADICVVGEGEYTFLELVKALKGKGASHNLKRNLKNVAGICFKDEYGKTIITKRRPLITNLDELPLPARHLLPPLSAYISPAVGESKLHTSVMTSRGCPFRCAFCDKSIFGRTFRGRSAKNVVDEIEILIKKYGMEEIRVFDDLFTFDKKRAAEICREIIRRRLNVSWCCDSRVDAVAPELLKLMKLAGCRQIDFGIESGSQKILDLMNKGTKLKQIRTAIRWTKDTGIKVKGYFILGLPGDTKKTINETIDFAKSLDLDYAAFFLYSPYPGTPLYEKLNRYGKIIASKWDEYVTFEMPAFLPNGLTKKDLESLYKKAYYEFYFRPKIFIKMIKDIRTPSVFFSYFKAALWALSSKFGM